MRLNKPSRDGLVDSGEGWVEKWRRGMRGKALGLDEGPDEGRRRGGIWEKNARLVIVARVWSASCDSYHTRRSARRIWWLVIPKIQPRRCSATRRDEGSSRKKERRVLARGGRNNLPLSGNVGMKEAWGGYGRYKSTL